MCHIKINLLGLSLGQLFGFFPFESIIVWCLILLMAMCIISNIVSAKLVFITPHHMIFLKIWQKTICLCRKCLLHYLLNCTLIRYGLDLLSYWCISLEFFAWFSRRCDFLNRIYKVNHWRINLNGFSCRCKDTVIALTLLLHHNSVRFMEHRLLCYLLSASTLLCSSLRSLYLLSRCGKYIDKYVVVTLWILRGIGQVLHCLSIVSHHYLR